MEILWNQSIVLSPASPPNQMDTVHQQSFFAKCYRPCKFTIRRWTEQREKYQEMRLKENHFIANPSSIHSCLSCLSCSTSPDALPWKSSFVLRKALNIQEDRLDQRGIQFVTWLFLPSIRMPSLIVPPIRSTILATRNQNEKFATPCEIGKIDLPPSILATDAGVASSDLNPAHSEVWLSSRHSNSIGQLQHQRFTLISCTALFKNALVISSVVCFFQSRIS